MEEVFKEDPVPADKLTEKIVDDENNDEESKKRVSSDKSVPGKRMEKGHCSENVLNEGDNLKLDNTIEVSKNEINDINSTVKVEKQSDVESLYSCSSGNNSNDGESVNIVKSGNDSLCNLLVYTSGDSSDSDSSSDSESFESPEISDNEPENEGATNTSKKKNMQDTIRTFGELSLDDLPPVPDVSTLNIDIDEHECVHMGNISGIIDRLVTVESLPNTPAYDIETLLFLENGKKPLGYVYELIGQVRNPIYVIRFNSKEEIENIGITKGLPVYSAPKTPHTQYVFLKQLMEVKGSDASWMGDNEVPPDHADFSDDEEERKVKKATKKSSETRKRNSLERHKDFEKDMNVKNIIDTRLHKIRDSFEPSTKRHASNNNDKRGFPFQPGAGPVFSFGQPGMNPNVPSFNPFLSAPAFISNGMQMSPFGALPYMPPMSRMPPPMQNVPFIPSIPPPQLPQTMAPHQPMPPHQMQNLHSIPVPPPSIPQMDMGQQKHPQQVPPRMMYPPDMGLPRPPRSPYVPLYNPRPPNVWTYQNRPQSFRPSQNFCQPRPRGTYYPKKPQT